MNIDVYKILKSSPIILRLNKISKIFEVDVRTIQNWTKKLNNPMPKNSRGNYDLLQCLIWRITFLENEIVELGAEGDKALNELRREGERLKNIERWLKVEKATNNLIDYNEVLRAYLNEVVIFKTNQNSMVFQLNSALEGVTESDERLNIIKKYANEVLEKIGDLKVNPEEYNYDELDNEEPDAA